MKLTVVTDCLRGGGGQRALSYWLNGWSDRGYNITVIKLLPHDGVGEEYPVRFNIKVIDLDQTEHPVSSRWAAGVRLVSNSLGLRKAVKGTRPDMVLAIPGPIVTRTLLACQFMKTPVLVMEQTHPGQYSQGGFWDKLRKWVYPTATLMLNLTENGAEWCRQHLGTKRHAVIPNPVLDPGFSPRLSDGHSKTIVAAGRLVEQKRFDWLISAFALIASKYPDWKLVIYGEGDDRADLEALIAEKGLVERVLLPGWTQSLAERMSEGEFFVLSSRYEGFGNVIPEAMAVGLPVVSFDCTAGPSDIIRPEIDGLLVPPADVDALAAAMERVMGDNALRLRMSQRAPEVLERFSLESTLKLWDDVFAKSIP